MTPEEIGSLADKAEQRFVKEIDWVFGKTSQTVRKIVYEAIEQALAMGKK